MNTQEIAKVCHEANAALCAAFGDYSQSPWDQAAEWQRASAIAGVTFALKNPSATPEDQHNAWCESKRKDGWVFGDVKDAEKKTHPCLVPYAQLPPFQKAKDYVFNAIVKATAD